MADARNTIIFGCRGMLARALAAEVSSRGQSFVGYDLPECDMTRAADVAAAFARHRPEVVYNCAAFTKVDLCEDQQDLANKVNGEAVGILAECAKAHGSKLIHVSTDFIFDGNGTRPYRTDDKPAPVSAYGRSKLLGETRLQDVNPAGWLIIRPAWLFGLGGLSFPRTMVEVARQGKPLRVVNDQMGCPTFTVDLAKAMVDVAAMDARGIFHFTNSGPTNWFEFARETLSQFKISADLQPTTTADYFRMRPKQAIRPAYSVLDCSSTESALGHKIRPWQQALAEFVTAVNAAGKF